ncbi:hypothetical protein P3X46_009791 [Hevea brasiliensis]|uniref:Ribosomal protein S1 n=1 Tax=Hevea brasiliensis TaxID=3981 RepID=W6JQD3_HEVBR|nr:ribosomal protein S1 [Hevea benthamiana]YP_010879457.1 ribosomal protein S1 [Hevea pauciflora]YP_010989343.1 ribosomal protein S1 [Hevea camargoana]YP_010989438.1 ribosomal protein S1 [Hevea spruceana]XP_021666130.1 ribosomal protein S1, mitochondrial [Hevea brasiliensis]KAJ9181687.1 hypothetical protein P3X46_009791 [Hevea brasiliensis]WHE44737.1 ribosomal protein S1 [Hevea benthamiana]WHE44794.1 ribosomal protein S1 [Hevea pauciflora]WOV67293.1 ribosomal protein S1 [Hevea benthamiana]
MTSIYLNRSFPRANSSFSLFRGNALQSSVLRLRGKMFLLDAGLGTPIICMQDELTGVPKNRATRFENKVGSLGKSMIKERAAARLKKKDVAWYFKNKVTACFFKNKVAGESMIKEHILERFFIDLVAGESMIKERAAARFNDLVGSTDVVAGEPLLLPRRFIQIRAWMELIKIWRTKKKVKGFYIKKIKGGYSVAIAGFITFLPFRPLKRKGTWKKESRRRWRKIMERRRQMEMQRRALLNGRFNIERYDPKWMNIVVSLPAEDQRRT